MKIAFLPIDNRPVCHQLPQMIVDINPEIEFFIPNIDLLGDLTKTANIDGLFAWLESLPKVDALILSLDTIAYGGLIPSRRSPETFEQIKKRIEKLRKCIINLGAKTYAFSSIMRISNNNINEEEKEYWNKYGTKIFNYSYNFHKSGTPNTEIPQEILDDYLATRKRNFEINKLYLNWQKEETLNTLIFSKDDCAEYGLNVKEAQELEALGGFTKTGADEIPLSLLARAYERHLKICPVFIEKGSKNLISNYEDISIEKSVLSQIELSGCKLAQEESADLTLYVNNFLKNQGEIVMKRATEPFSGKWQKPTVNYAIADVRFANGADNELVKQILEQKIDQHFLGYSAWNTSANTLGSLLCALKFTKTQNEAFKKLQAIRLLDDWAYQANVRQQLTQPNIEELTEKMQPYEDIVKKFLGINFRTKYSFPWNRLFEVKIELS